MKLTTNIPHVSGHCWKDVQMFNGRGQRSKVKVTARQNGILRRRHTFRRRRGLFVLL